MKVGREREAGFRKPKSEDLKLSLEERESLALASCWFFWNCETGERQTVLGDKKKKKRGKGKESETWGGERKNRKGLWV